MTQGWILADDLARPAEPWEVRVSDVSRFGVGFESTAQIDHGQVIRIRIGRGPLELSRRIRVVRCNPHRAGTFAIGGEFI